MKSRKGNQKEVRKNFLVGLRCKDWGKGCDCQEYTVEGAREILKEKYNCIYEDACFYDVVSAKDADSLNIFMIIRQLDENITSGLVFTDFYLVAQVVPNK